MKRWLLLIMTLFSGCKEQHASPTRIPESPAPASASTAAPPYAAAAAPPASAPALAPAPEPVRVEAVDLASGRRVFVVRGVRGHHAGVFLHGLCGHPKFYLDAFQYAAADYGPFIAPNGDMPCNGEYRSWSGKLPPLEDQIALGLRAAGVDGDASDVTLIGYSMGGTRALELARRAPERFTALILIATPEKPTPKGLASLRGVVMMAGSRDRQDLMKAGAHAFENAGIPATFMTLPGAAHGEMGPNSEVAMKAALSWIDAQPKSR